MKKLLNALHFAADAHRDQRRKGAGNSPYINHLIEVANLLSDSADVTDEDVLAAAVLHDVIEDTDIGLDTLNKKFGRRVGLMVVALSDDKSLPLEERRQYQLDHLDKAPDEIKLIKLADHCSNIASIPPRWDYARVQEYLAWSHAVASKCFVVSEQLKLIYLLRRELALEYLEEFENTSHWS